MSSIQIEGKFVEEDNEGNVVIEIDVDDVFNEIGDWEIREYAKYELDMFEDLNEFDDEEFIIKLEQSGYVVTEKENIPELDIIDYNMLEEIKAKFYFSSVFEREKIWKKIIKEV